METNSCINKAKCQFRRFRNLLFINKNKKNIVHLNGKVGNFGVFVVTLVL